MNKIKQYRPGYFYGFENQEIIFNTEKELLEIDFVKNFSNEPNFFHFAISTINKKRKDDKTEKHYLIAVYENGSTWWVVGTLDNVIDLEIPLWEPGK